MVLQTSSTRSASLSGSTIPSSTQAPKDDQSPQVWEKTYRQIEMEKDWELIDDLLGGTRRMRSVGEKWLPREEKEQKRNWKNRLNRTFLYEGLHDTFEKHAARPFSIPVSTRGKLPVKLQPMINDIDRSGTSLHELAEDMFRDLEKRGLTHLFVDTPAIEGPLTLAEEEKKRVRPYFVHVPANRFLGGIEAVNAEGERVYTQVRFSEFHEEKAGNYGTKIIHYIRVINAPVGDQKGTWELWREDEGATKGKSFKIKKRGTHAYPGVPFLTIQLNKKEDGGARPPLQKLAEMNVLHWQSSSDHRHILKFARIGILFARGLSKDQVEAGITISSNQAFLTSSEVADMKYVMYDSSIIEAGEKDLERLEDRMEVLGMQPLLERAEDVTATGVAANENKSMTVMQMWLTRLEQGLKQAFKMAALWYSNTRSKITIPEDFQVQIFKDFFVRGDSNENEFLLNAAMLGKLPSEVFLYEIQRRGVIAPHWDLQKVADDGAKEEKERAEAELVRSVKQEETTRRTREMLSRSGPGNQSTPDN